ncbi:UvrD-helicase domain-containing protein [Pararhizobium sp. A13]|uniref:UvrD-helicase domain-containing protein n=1 Tax=Pararhizobium sp. A13 TaxID=3133975 RepID=UPI0032537803
MTDDDIAALLRSDIPLVVIEAPAGCGKTFQAALYAEEVARQIGHKKVLVLTHTHAACSVVAKRTKEIRRHIELRTLDGFIHEVASAYRTALGLPDDVATWARTTANGFDILASKVADFIRFNPMISRMLARRYPVIICDEHQDSSSYQEAIVLLIGEQGSMLRIFGDPMQVIPGGHGQGKRVTEVRSRWEALKTKGSFGTLETGHRWKDTNPGLGKWVLDCRMRLRDGLAVDLSGKLPAGINVLVAENGLKDGQGYQFSPENGDWLQIPRQSAPAFRNDAAPQFRELTAPLFRDDAAP